MGGLFGTVSKTSCITDLFYGTDYHSHLGTVRAGLAVMNGSECQRSIHNIENDYFRSKFEPDLHLFTGTKGIGIISDTDPQPLIIGSHLGTFGIVTVGKIKNLEQLAREAYDKRRHFTETRDGKTHPTELVAMLICQEASFEAGISRAQETIQGSCTLMLLTEKGIFAARDKLGRTPLVIGKKAGAFALCSETCSLPTLGYEIDKELGPGEIVFVTEDGWEQRKKPQDKMQICSFLWIYYGYPASSYEGAGVEAVRYRCGAALAKKDDLVPDIVAGIPDSGTGHAIGYANEKRIQFSRPFVKYTPTWPRSFMPQNQEVRDLVARMKLIPIRDLIQGQRILFCEDSIVRGTQLKDHIRGMFEYGALEVHMRPACPTLIFPCEFLNFSSSRSTLALAGRKAIKELDGSDDTDLHEYARTGSAKNAAMVERIRLGLGLTSLQYQHLDDLVAAIGLPRERLCTHCWAGDSYF